MQDAAMQDETKITFYGHKRPPEDKELINNFIYDLLEVEKKSPFMVAFSDRTWWLCQKPYKHVPKRFFHTTELRSWKQIKARVLNLDYLDNGNYNQWKRDEAARKKCRVEDLAMTPTERSNISRRRNVHKEHFF